MDTPFVLEVRAPRRSDARQVADALGRLLGDRRLAVRLDGQPRYRGDVRVDILTTERGDESLTVLVGVRSPDGEPLWLSPLELPQDAPEDAARQTLGFLERWGFVATPSAPAVDARLTGVARPSVA